MDCEKFETLLLDELYDELDELTSAAVKRHVAGCARCSSLLNGLKATRRVAVLPLVEPPADLEERILQAARDAQKVVPIRRRFAGVVSLAGNWAMRPQTAMAALFLLMIGSSALFLRSRQPGAPASATMTVTEKGTPSPTAAVAEDDRLDTRTAAAAHGPQGQAYGAPAFGAPDPAPAAAMANAPGAAASAFAMAPPEDKAKESQGGGSAGFLDGVLGGRDRAREARKSDEESRGALGQSMDPYDMRNAGPAAGAPRPMTQAAPAAPAQAERAPAKSRAGDTADDFSTAMSSYHARSYGDAARQFDAVATTGDNNAALWAARSVREANGCPAAVARFDAISNRAFGSYPGYEATLDSARCYRTMGATDRARAQLSRLLGVSSYAALAQNEIDAMSQVASRKAAASAPNAAATATTTPRAATPPAKPLGKTESGF